MSPLSNMISAGLALPSFLNVSSPSTGLTELPVPKLPDMLYCPGPWVTTHKVETDDCINAVRGMPSGWTPELFHTRSWTGGEEYKLPLVRRSGSCEVAIYPSGIYASENNFTISVAPNAFRGMVLVVLQECSPRRESGFSTRFFNRTTAWITDPQSGFPTNMNMPYSTLYFTGMAWSIDELAERPPNWNPGDSSYWALLQIGSRVDTALMGADPLSPEWTKLRRKQAWIQESRRLRPSFEYNSRWWERPAPAGALTSVQ